MASERAVNLVVEVAQVINHLMPEIAESELPAWYAAFDELADLFDLEFENGDENED